MAMKSPDDKKRKRGGEVPVGIARSHNCKKKKIKVKRAFREERGGGVKF